MPEEFKKTETAPPAENKEESEFNDTDRKDFEEEIEKIRLFTHWIPPENMPPEEIDKENNERIKKIAAGANILDKGLNIPKEFYSSIKTLNNLADIQYKCSEIWDIVQPIYERNLPVIESYVKNDQNLFNYDCLYAMNYLAVYGGGSRGEGIKALSNHIDALEFSMNFDPSYLYFPFIETLVKKGDSETAEKALSVLGKNLFYGKWGISDYNLLIQSFSSIEEDIRKIADTVIERELTQYGLDTKKFIDAWCVSIPWVIGIQKVLEIGGMLENNIQTIKDIEAQRPGAVSFLNKEFGIFDFGRYPVEMLISQYDNYNDNEKPYGVVFYPRDDNNGAFYYNVGVFKQLFEQLNSAGFNIRVAEGEDKIGIVKLLHKLDRKYGKKHKIAFAIIGGHGTWDSIKFGDNDKKHTLNMVDLFDKKHPAVTRRKFFEDSPTFILNSCSTGAEYGIAEQLSSEIGATVIAPEKPTNIKSINVKIENGRPEFSVTYHEEGIAKTYVAGKEK